MFSLFAYGTCEVVEIFAAEIGQASEYTTDGILATEKRRQELMELLPGKDDALPPRRIEDSFVSAIVPLRSNPKIRERYVTSGGQVRIGRLLEDMDVFAGSPYLIRICLKVQYKMLMECIGYESLLLL